MGATSLAYRETNGSRISRNAGSRQSLMRGRGTPALRLCSQFLMLLRSDVASALMFLLEIPSSHSDDLPFPQTKAKVEVLGWQILDHERFPG